MSSTGMGGRLAHGSVTVDTTTSGGEVIVASRHRKSLTVQNVSATVDVYVGGTGEAGTGLTTSNGLKLSAGSALSFDEFTGALSGIVAASSADVRFFEVY